jgi:hypothetical protein
MRILHRFRGSKEEGAAKMERNLVVDKKGIVVQEARISIAPMMLDPDARVRSACFARCPATTRGYRLLADNRRAQARKTRRFMWHRPSASTVRDHEADKYQLFVQEQIIESPYTFVVPVLLLDMLVTEKTKLLAAAGVAVDGSAMTCSGKLAQYVQAPAPFGEPTYLPSNMDAGSAKDVLDAAARSGRADTDSDAAGDRDAAASPPPTSLGSPGGSKPLRKRKGKTPSSHALVALAGAVPVASVVEQLKLDKELLSSYRASKTTFKPSVDKSKKDVPHIGTNLHVHSMYVTSDKDHEVPGASAEARYDFITIGAFAAHTLKFKKDGIWNMEEKLLRKGDDMDLEQQAAARFAIMQRTEVAFSQALSGLVTSFVSTLTTRVLAGDSAFLAQMSSVGFLFQMESLLSTYKNELGMISDMASAISRLNRVQFFLRAGQGKLPVQQKGAKLSPKEADEMSLRTDATDPRNLLVTPARVRRDGEHVVVELELRNMNALSLMELDADATCLGRPIKVFGVCFSQGINEFQTVAQQVGDTSFQTTVNRASLPIINGYSEAYSRHLEETLGEASVQQRACLKRDRMALQRLVDKAAEGCKTGKSDGCKLLMTVAATVRRLNGGRTTCCKSAKDRTSMSVTLEQARILTTKHNFPQHAHKPVLYAMRSRGVRLENSCKNTGHMNYAFNRIQKAALPAEYRPPDVVLGGLIT